VYNNIFRFRRDSVRWEAAHTFFTPPDIFNEPFNCPEQAGEGFMTKKRIETIREKNRIIDNIIEALVQRNSFLLLGHENPDEDCIASMVAFSILLSKFSKEARICLGKRVHEHFGYLLSICRYNAIEVFTDCASFRTPVDTLVICDTPKPSMVERMGGEIDALMENKNILKIEFDHHLGADSTYIGDEGYCLVTEATSAAELVGHVALKLRGRRDILERFQIDSILTRNLVLAILSGIIGDTNMGKFIKSRREQRFYDIFSRLLNELLAKETTKSGNLGSIKEVYGELQRLSSAEDMCYRFFMERKKRTPEVAYTILSDREMELLLQRADNDAIVSVARAIANELAEESGKLSLIAYYDHPSVSDLVQFRMRRSKDYKRYDLRNVLEMFSIENGGGHEGAIGFRLPRSEVNDLKGYVENMLENLGKVLPA